jgi:CheY-like chemotaxis protein
MNTILLMDEDPKLSSVLKKVLARNGKQIVTSPPSYEILDLVKIHKPSLIVLDYIMGEVNGGELCGMLKENSATKDIPVIVYSLHDRVFSALGNYGCDLFLPKTADIYSLNLEIDNLLRSRSQMSS